MKSDKILGDGQLLQVFRDIRNTGRVECANVLRDHIAAQAAKLAEKDALLAARLSALGSLRQLLAARDAEIGLLRRAIMDYISGDYSHGKEFRPGDCPHGAAYYQDCLQCVDDHFQEMLDL